MSTTTAAMPIYHDPRPTRTRRSSSRRSFASPLSRSASDLNQPRAACPKDADAFSYDRAHLRVWYLDDAFWARLPPQLQSSLADVQHAGAAVLTGFERLEKHKKNPCRKLILDELSVGFDDIPPPKYRTISDASSVFPSDISSPPTASTSASQSACTSPVVSSSSMSGYMSPTSPTSLGPPAVGQRSSSRDRSFSTPLEPEDAYYDTELSHLHTEALPRLRHKCHKVDTEWNEVKRVSIFSTDDANTFENYWAEQKCRVLELSDKGKRLADERGLAPTGMGWCAP